MTRRATVRTTHPAPGVIAAALRPDNTDAMRTKSEENTLVTTIERPGTGGLASTVDDYLVNLQVATAVHAHAAPDSDASLDTEPTTDADIGVDIDTDTDTDDDTDQPTTSP